MEDFEGFQEYCLANQMKNEPRSQVERVHYRLENDVFNNPKKYGFGGITKRWREVIFKGEDGLKAVPDIIMMDGYKQVYLLEIKTTSRSRGGIENQLKRAARIISEQFGIEDPRLIAIRKSGAGFNKTEFPRKIYEKL